MIRFADPQPRQNEGLSDGKTNNIIYNNSNKNNGILKTGAVSKATVTQEENKQQQDTLKLIVSHELLCVIITTTVLVIVMFKAYLRLTKKEFATEIRQTRLCGWCQLSEKRPLLAGSGTQLIQQLRLLMARYALVKRLWQTVSL